MSDVEKNGLDDFWRKAFEDADETPPSRVWSAIERRLDESNGPCILPLWGTGLASSRPFVWGAGIAAAVALLLVGWWAMNTQTHEPLVAGTGRSSATEHVADSKNTLRPQGDNPSVATNKQSIQPSQPLADDVARYAEQSVATQNRIALTPSKAKQRVESSNADSQEAFSTSLPQSVASVPNTATFMSSQTVERALAARQEADIKTSASALNTSLAFGQLANKPLRLRKVGPIQRIVWFRPAELQVEPESVRPKHESREVWASVSMMPSSFNPSVAVRTAQASTSNAFVASTANSNQLSVNSRASFSVAYQAGAGVQLTDHWSVESGVGYLSGRSTVESPSQAAVASFQVATADRNGTTNNLYVDALRSSTRNVTASNTIKGSYDMLLANGNYTLTNMYNSRTPQLLTNDYQFMQVPVQVGYQLRPHKRLGIALLGGLLTNIFVRNTVGNEIVVTAKDGVYRPVSFAATMGARFRYRPSRRWSASLAGLYQPALEAGTQTSSQVESRPTLTGMSFGVDYHF